ncbi:hypothetical protein BO82DRAFT_133976 [Aspergillus uvarum CBS 121591]|uniref:Uncharacterized protein n=1 Tax=Aspergillus uvarum CBS 121591 TaxID=1448315 RepID=A0A319DJ83_9EURO|nr:hypothetical protein BO82DRAFT_133976 [Aspergillus uvarum CBS 121591]PYH79492.1 hypothetical protein BO82DRAFT_133976 [Aspergillus uvarum CBS 121591]
MGRVGLPPCARGGIACIGYLPLPLMVGWLPYTTEPTMYSILVVMSLFFFTCTLVFDFVDAGDDAIFYTGWVSDSGAILTNQESYIHTSLCTSVSIYTIALPSTSNNNHNHLTSSHPSKIDHQQDDIKCPTSYHVIHSTTAINQIKPNNSIIPSQHTKPP